MECVTIKKSFKITDVAMQCHHKMKIYEEVCNNGLPPSVVETPAFKPSSPNLSKVALLVATQDNTLKRKCSKRSQKGSCILHPFSASKYIRDVGKGFGNPCLLHLILVTFSACNVHAHSLWNGTFINVFYEFLKHMSWPQWWQIRLSSTNQAICGI